MHYQGQYAELIKRGPQDTDLTAILPALETLRTARGGYADRARGDAGRADLRPLPGREAGRGVDRCAMTAR